MSTERYGPMDHSMSVADLRYFRGRLTLGVPGALSSIEILNEGLHQGDRLIRWQDMLRCQVRVFREGEVSRGMLLATEFAAISAGYIGRNTSGCTEVSIMLAWSDEFLRPPPPSVKYSRADAYACEEFVEACWRARGVPNDLVESLSLTVGIARRYRWQPWRVRRRVRSLMAEATA